MSGVLITKKVIKEALGLDMEDSEIANMTAADFHRTFKVEDLKRILKHFRNYGYHTSIKKNKRELVKSVLAIATGATVAGDFDDNNSSTSANYMSSDVPHHATSSLSSYVPGHGDGDFMLTSLSGTNDLKPTVLPTGDKIPLALQSQGLCSTKAPHSITNMSSTQSSSVALPCTSPFQSIRDDLLKWECFSSAQIEHAIRCRLSKGVAITLDLVVNDLLGVTDDDITRTRDLEKQEIELQRRYEEDMDRAILNSEEGRDHIQACKKQRTLELKEDNSCLLDEASEFSNSFLLGKRNSIAAVSENSSPPIVKVLKELVTFLDSTGRKFLNFSDQSMSSSGGASKTAIDEKALQDLRRVTFSILDLEMKSYKWYQDRALGYFIDMEKRLSRVCVDKDVPIDLQELLWNFVSVCSRNDSSNQCEIIRRILNTLQLEVDDLANHLYSLNSKGVPQAFLNCDLDNIHEKKYSLEDDGFEIL